MPILAFQLTGTQLAVVLASLSPLVALYIHRAGKKADFERQLREQRLPVYAQFLAANDVAMFVLGAWYQAHFDGTLSVRAGLLARRWANETFPELVRATMAVQLCGPPQQWDLAFSAAKDLEQAREELDEHNTGPTDDLLKSAAKSVESFVASAQTVLDLR